MLDNTSERASSTYGAQESVDKPASCSSEGQFWSAFCMILQRVPKANWIPVAQCGQSRHNIIFIGFSLCLFFSFSLCFLILLSWITPTIKPLTLKPMSLALLSMCVLVAQSCPTLCSSTDHSPPGSSVHGILQARILQWVAVPFFRGSSQPRDQTQVSHIAGRLFTIWAKRKPIFFQGQPEIRKTQSFYSWLPLKTHIVFAGNWSWREKKKSQVLAQSSTQKMSKFGSTYPSVGRNISNWVSPWTLTSVNLSFWGLHTQLSNFP